MAEGDSLLVQRALSGDLEGFGELHRRYYQRVVRVVLRIVKDQAQAEDLVQDAYLSALKDLPRLVAPDRFYPWLCRIAVNRAIEDRRRTARRARWNVDWDPAGERESRVPSTEPTALTGMVSREEAERVRQALEQLPEGQRAALVLRYFEGLSMRDVAEMLGCGEVTARTQVFRGLQKLALQLKATAS